MRARGPEALRTRIPPATAATNAATSWRTPRRTGFMRTSSSDRLIGPPIMLPSLGRRLVEPPDRERDEVLRRDHVRDDLEELRHPVDREDVPGQEDERQEEGERHLHRLHLGLRERGQEDAEPEHGGDEHEPDGIELDDAARDRHLEQETHEDDDERELEEADHDERREFGEDELDARDRRD